MCAYVRVCVCVHVLHRDAIVQFNVAVISAGHSGVTIFWAMDPCPSGCMLPESSWCAIPGPSQHRREPAVHSRPCRRVVELHPNTHI